MAISPEILDEIEYERPKKRGDCEHGLRPCPWIMCRYHMIWLVNDESGESRKRPVLYDPIARLTDDQVIEQIMTMKDTCVLDIAQRGGATLEEIGEALGVTRERIRQIEDHFKQGMMESEKLTGEIIASVNGITRQTANHRFTSACNQKEIGQCYAWLEHFRAKGLPACIEKVKMKGQVRFFVWRALQPDDMIMTRSIGALTRLRHPSRSKKLMQFLTH